MNIINEDRLFELELNGMVMRIRGKIIKLIGKIGDENVYEVVFKERNNAKMNLRYSYIIQASQGVI